VRSSAVQSFQQRLGVTGLIRKRVGDTSCSRFAARLERNQPQSHCFPATQRITKPRPPFTTTPACYHGRGPRLKNETTSPHSTISSAIRLCRVPLRPGIPVAHRIAPITNSGIANAIGLNGSFFQARADHRGRLLGLTRVLVAFLEQANPRNRSAPGDSASRANDRQAPARGSSTRSSFASDSESGLFDQPRCATNSCARLSRYAPTRG